jgi:hypothetical protein
MNRTIIIAKGSSVLTREIGSEIDKFDVVIRVNHLPDDSNKKNIGSKTSIFCSRSNDKILKFKSELKNIKYWHTHPTYIIEKKTEEILSDIEETEYLSDLDLKLIHKHFKLNFTTDYTTSENDKVFGFSFPDTGISSIIMTLNRFKDDQIFIHGFDNYKNKNRNIYGINSDTSVFKTPVLSQEIFLKRFIKYKRITIY